MRSPDRFIAPLATVAAVVGLSTVLAITEQRPTNAAPGSLHHSYLPFVSADKPTSINQSTTRCLQVLTGAINEKTGEYKIFPDSCLPVGWRRIELNQP